VILIGRWSLYTQGDYDKAMKGYFLTSPESDEISRSASREVFAHAVAKTVAAYEPLGAKVLIVLQIPQQKFDPLKIYSKLAMNNLLGSREAESSIQMNSVRYLDHLSIQRYSRDVFGSLENGSTLTTFDPDPYFCSGNRCMMGTSTEPYYRDADHVSSTGAFLLEKPMGDLLKDMIAGSRNRSSNSSLQNP